MKKIRLAVILMVMAGTFTTVSATDLGAIWFIGDSITQSNADGDASGSPRKSLYDLLTANGYTFTYTGHFTANTDGLPATGLTAADNLYHYHSGISGSVIGDDYGNRVGMTENMVTHWTSGRTDLVKPDIILIMLGANDIQQAIDLPNAPTRLKALVQSIYDLPGVGSPAIYLASITPNGQDATKTANVIAFNAMVPGIVSDLKNEGKDIHFVDQFTAINDDYATLMRSDNLHPNAAGNDVMAQTWFDEIATVDVPQFLPGGSVSNGNFNISFSGTLGEHYRLESAQNLTHTGTWHTVTDMVSLGTSPLPLVISATNATDFFRLRWLP